MDPLFTTFFFYTTGSKTTAVKVPKEGTTEEIVNSILTHFKVTPDKKATLITTVGWIPLENAKDVDEFIHQFEKPLIKLMRESGGLRIKIEPKI